jgi:hypothetical protein
MSQPASELSLDLPAQVKTRPAGEADKRAAALVVFFLTMALVFLMAARSPIDTDLWWHLRAGQVTVEQGAPLLRDAFSFTRAGAAWTNHSWLAQVVLYLLYRWGGFVAIGGLVAALATLSMAFLFHSMDGPELFRAFVIVLAALVAAWVWSARPQIFSLVLFAMVGWVLYRFKWKKQKFLWALIPIFILWSNLHAGYALGLLLLGAFLAGEVFNRLVWNPGTAPLTSRDLLQLAGWSVLAGIAVLVNPNGIDTWLVPFRTVEVGAIQKLISEWASPDFHEIGQQAMLILFLLGVISFAFARKRVDGTDLVPFLLFGYMAFVARRNFGPFALAAAPAISRTLWPAAQDWWEGFQRRFPAVTGTLADRIAAGQARTPPAWLRKTLNLGLVAVFSLFAFVKLYAVSCQPMMDFYLPQYFPVQAVDWIAAHKPAGQMFNSYNWGGYLTWQLPQYPVFIDGRTDLYNDDIINQWLEAVNASPGWQETLDRWNIRLILLEPSQPLTKVLGAEGWKLLYADKQAAIYGR